MADSEILLTIAEVAVAFAGFASLVGILGRRSARDDPRILGARMRGMILFSLVAVGFSLVPFILHRYGLAEATVWRLASALFLGALGAIAVWLWRSIRRLNVGSANRHGIGAVLASAIGAGLVILALNVLGVAPTLGPALYLTALGLLLFLAGFAFVLILFSFLPTPDSE